MNNKVDTDINYIIQMSLNGDKKYQEILLSKLKPLIYRNIYMHWNSNDSMIEDLLQEGYIVVLDALQSFDKNKEAHFLAFIKSKIKFFYMNYYRSSLKHSKILTNSKKFDQIADLEESIELKNLKDEENSSIMSCISKLSQKEQQLIYSYYFDEIPMGEISKNLNISYSATSNRKSRIIKKLRKCLIRR